jgi:hypothetical protein
MRLTFLGHACHLVESGGLRILTDPWLCDPIFAGHVERDPPLAFGVGDLPPIDAIALTHGHLDHFNAPALARWPDKSIPVVLPAIRFTEVDTNLRRLGFHHLHPRRDWEPFELGRVRVVPTPAAGVLDECAYCVQGPDGAFWNGADAPQPPNVVTEVAARLGPIEAGAFSHNSFDQPALLGLASRKPADHGPLGAARAARVLGVDFALAAASNMRWTGSQGELVTRKVIRRGAADFAEALSREAPGVRFLDLRPGDAWSREGGIERGALRGTAEPRVATDCVHAFCPDGSPEVEATFRRDLPARLRAVPEAARYVGQRVEFRIRGDEAGTWTVDFRHPDAAPLPGTDDAPFALEVDGADWRALFERRIPWQVLLVSDRLRVRRLRPGPAPEGLHFVYALQGIFP